MSDEETATYNGQIGDGTVTPALEAFLTKLAGKLRREKDQGTLTTINSPPVGRTPVIVVQTLRVLAVDRLRRIELVLAACETRG